ncbi:MAG: hypothetical protein MZV65_43070 [Chromatiales bacterium]|nr:hypothetical protein [Chromatiales bacterium]
MNPRPRTSAGAVPAAPAADLASRLASAAAQAVRKTHVQTGTIPGRTRSGEFRVRFGDGRTAIYRVQLDFVREVRQ